MAPVSQSGVGMSKTDGRTPSTKRRFILSGGALSGASWPPPFTEDCLGKTEGSHFPYSTRIPSGLNRRYVEHLLEKLGSGEARPAGRPGGCSPHADRLRPNLRSRNKQSMRKLLGPKDLSPKLPATTSAAAARPRPRRQAATVALGRARGSRRPRGRSRSCRPRACSRRRPPCRHR